MSQSSNRYIGIPLAVISYPDGTTRQPHLFYIRIRSPHSSDYMTAKPSFLKKQFSDIKKWACRQFALAGVSGFARMMCRVFLMNSKRG
tara:strand:+ start:3231 stop:3494 length:264 start_codon:yes stop_codon:yes gene_type:complete